VEPPIVGGPSVLAYGKDRQVVSIKFQKLFQSAKRPCLTCNLPICKNHHDDHIKNFGLKKVLAQAPKKNLGSFNKLIEQLIRVKIELL
jgi:hypothetical protein